ncbi:MAG: phosphopantetheine-binding protein [Planctomycetota bacterium]
MSDVERILERLRSLGVDLSLEAGQLRLEGPKDALTADLRETLRALKPQLVEHLQSAGAAEPSAPPPARAAGGREPTTPAEHAVAAIWSEVLELERIPVDGNFFDLGGYSQLGATIVERVRDELGFEMSIRELFLYPTVAALAAHVDGAAATAEDARR